MSGACGVRWGFCVQMVRGALARMSGDHARTRPDGVRDAMHVKALRCRHGTRMASVRSTGSQGRHLTSALEVRRKAWGMDELRVSALARTSEMGGHLHWHSGIGSSLMESTAQMRVQHWTRADSSGWPSEAWTRVRLHVN